MTSRHGLEIRAATAADAPGMATLLAASGHNLNAAELAERLAALRGGNAAALLAVQWGPPSGLLVMAWYPTLEAARPVALVSTLLVAADDRRQGIGRLLIKAAAQAARVAGCGDMMIAAGANAPSLQEFCRATGFSETGPHFIRSLRKQA